MLAGVMVLRHAERAMIRNRTEAQSQHITNALWVSERHPLILLKTPGSESLVSMPGPRCDPRGVVLCCSQWILFDGGQETAVLLRTLQFSCVSRLYRLMVVQILWVHLYCILVHQ